VSDAAELLTVKEYAELFRWNEQSLYRRIRAGKFTRFPVEKDGDRRILIMVPSAIVERLRNGRQRAAGSRPV